MSMVLLVLYIHKAYLSYSCYKTFRLYLSNIIWVNNTIRYLVPAIMLNIYKQKQQIDENSVETSMDTRGNYDDNHYFNHAPSFLLNQLDFFYLIVYELLLIQKDFYIIMFRWSQVLTIYFLVGSMLLIFLFVLVVYCLLCVSSSCVLCAKRFLYL